MRLRSPSLAAGYTSRAVGATTFHVHWIHGLEHAITTSSGMLLPRYSSDIIGPILWILGAIFSTIGYRGAPRTP